MTEYELLSLLVERRVEMISILQWWGGISFALIAGAHILERQLSILLLALMDGFYLFFSFVSFRFLITIGDQFRASFADLKEIENASLQTQETISQFTGNAVELNRILIAAACVVVVSVVCVYPIWLYRQKGVAR